MKYKTTIRYALIGWPKIMRNEAMVREQLFCCGGNGYDWYWGELVETHPSEKWLPKCPFIINLLWHTFRWAFCLYAQPYRRRLDRAFRYIQQRERELGLEDHTSARFDLTCAINIPDDVKPDWLDGVFEMLEFIKNNEHDNKAGQRNVEKAKWMERDYREFRRMCDEI